jgi:predicted choloylglycine hydrolase
MLRIETQGSAYQIGKSIGETFPRELDACIDRYAPWLRERNKELEYAVERLDGILRRGPQDILQETRGMSDGSGIEIKTMIGYRFFPDVRTYVPEDCSVVYFAESDQGPLLGRNCDLSPEFDQDVQICHLSRPEDGIPTMTVGYLGLPGPPGLNLAGLAKGGASAHTPRARRKRAGLPNALLGGRLLGCRSLDEALAQVKGKVFQGKPLNLIVGDAEGRSVILEFAPGRTPVMVRRREGRRWQACTNFFTSGKLPIAPETEYLESAYARYGRIVERLEGGHASLTLEGMKELLTEIAQPGICSTGLRGTVKTAYSHICEVGRGRMHLAPGHPSEVPYEEVSLDN